MKEYEAKRRELYCAFMFNLYLNYMFGILKEEDITPCTVYGYISNEMILSNFRGENE